jgi:ketosteroid isomerase-like protein
MSQGNVEVVRTLMDAGRRDDLPAALACIHPEVEFIPLRAGTEGVYHGHAGVEKFWADNRETFERFEPNYELRDLGDRVLAWGTIHVRGRGSGVEMDIPTGGIFQLRDGKIIGWHDYGSKEKALEAAGMQE